MDALRQKRRKGRPKVNSRRRVFQRFKYPPTLRPPEDALIRQEEQQRFVDILTCWFEVLSQDPRWLSTFAMLLAGSDWSFASIGRVFGLSRQAPRYRLKVAAKQIREKLGDKLADLFIAAVASLSKGKTPLQVHLLEMCELYVVLWIDWILFRNADKEPAQISPADHFRIEMLMVIDTFFEQNSERIFYLMAARSKKYGGLSGAEMTQLTIYKQLIKCINQILEILEEPELTQLSQQRVWALKEKMISLEKQLGN